MGVRRWKMKDIITSLPLLIFFSLFLFFIGVADWLWHVNRLVSCVIIVGIGIGCLAYVSVTIIAIIWIESPFRTPVSKTLTVYCRDIVPWIKALFIHLPPRLFQLARHGNLRMIQLLRQEWEIARDEVTWVPRSFAKCEEAIIDKNESISTKSLLWLASSIEILPHSYNSLVLLIQEFMQLPPHLLVRRQKSRIAPWKPVFQILCSAYLDKKSIEDYTSDEIENAGFLCKALSMLRVEMFGSRFDGFYESLKHGNNEAISTVAHMATLRRGVYLDGLERGLVRLCDSVKYLSLHYFHVQLLIVRQE
jgi:hypothetical protein